jgi:hypothetical protein
LKTFLNLFKSIPVKNWILLIEFTRPLGSRQSDIDVYRGDFKNMKKIWFSIDTGPVYSPSHLLLQFIDEFGMIREYNLSHYVAYKQHTKMPRIVDIHQMDLLPIISKKYTEIFPPKCPDFLYTRHPRECKIP